MWRRLVLFLHLAFASSLLLVALSVTCCVSFPSEEPPYSVESPTVWVHASSENSVSAGSGVCLHSSPTHGHYFLTNAHVILAWFTPANDVRVGFTEGEGVSATVMVSRLDWMSGELLDERLDLAVLWSPYLGEVYPSLQRIAPANPSPGDAVRVATYRPRPHPHVLLGAAVASMGWVTELLMEEEVIPGNSGSAVYDAEDRLVGLIWGSKTGSMEAQMVGVPAIREALSTPRLRWLLDEKSK